MLLSPAMVAIDISFMALLLFLAAGFALMLLAKKCGWSGLIALPVLAALLMFASFFFQGSSQPVEQVFPMAQIGIAAVQSEPIVDPTLEALWDNLTKSRINLSGEDESAPLADPKDEQAKQAVRETFGLGEQGRMPPTWVINPPKRIGQIYRESVASDPFVTEAECHRQLEQQQIPEAVTRRMESLAASQVSRPVTIGSPLDYGMGIDYILREIARDEFVGTVDSSVGEMKKVHVLLEFTPGVDQMLKETWLRHERHQRLASFSKIVAMSLMGLAAVYGLLRFDTWSKGYYSKQLLVGGVLAIIAFAVVFLQS